jgi:hypothetical protein
MRSTVLLSLAVFYPVLALAEGPAVDAEAPHWP